ncbi:MAG: hypothetical protein H7328_11120 [Bdellovibrio sp.]|nr:hypothetical protein [Bdellovibrio sp.]
MKYLSAFLFIFAVGCQMAPTKVMEESVNVFAENTVLVDTRSAFNYASFHIVGSVNLVTEDFLILKNPLTKRRIFDPDLKQTIERLARRGISPNKKIILISDQAKSDENKKWQWLFKNIEIEDVNLTGFEDFRKKYPNRAFSEPTRSAVWKLQISEDLQNEFIFKKAPDCFVKWSDKKCNRAF